MVGTLYVVAAPVADARDLTLRARLILAADVRHAAHLLAEHGLTTPFIAPAEPSQPTGFDRILGALETGDVAVLGAGWLLGPSGPSYRIIRVAIERGYPVVPIPGPSLPIAALVVSGLPADSFVYLGQLPRGAAARRALLSSVAGERRTLVAVVPAKLLPDALADLAATLGDRPLVVAKSDCRPGEIWRGTVGGACGQSWSQWSPGLCALVAGGAREEAVPWDEERLRAEIRTRLDDGYSAKEIGRLLAIESGCPRREIYRLAVEENQREKA
jgi:16S rRNA (cytidine1402-2'-O)-methyltransferase